MRGNGDDFFRSISSILGPGEPIERLPSETAAVAVIFREAKAGEELLLIRRSDREGDPWSGQVALPGGRVERGDASFMETAIREAREEVGVSLDIDSSFVGYMGSFRARTRGILVVPAVFASRSELPVSANREVASYRWVRFGEIFNPENRSVHLLRVGEVVKEFPAFEIGDYLIWGLTERILTSLGDAAGRETG